MPRTARPPLSTWSASAADAVTAASRVIELLTPGPRRIRSVAFAASISCPHTSGARFWLSGKSTVWRPSASSRRAVSAARPGPATARTPTSILREGPEIDPVELRDVVAEDRAPLRRREVARVLGQHLLRPGPRGVAVREVVGPHEPSPVHHVDALERDPVVLERRVDALGEVLRRQLRERLAGRQPVPVALEGVVHAVHVVRHPPGVGLDADDAELRVALEDAAQHQRPHDVLAAADDGEKRVHARPAYRGAVARREDVEGERQPEVDRRLPEVVVRRRIVVLDARVAGHHHAAEPHRRDRPDVLDALRGRAHRGLSDAEQAVRVRRAIRAEPAVVGVAAGLLVIEVAVVADGHADGRIDDLGRDAVALLVGHPRLGIPTAAVEILEARAHEADLLRRLARGGDDAERDRHLEPLDHEDVAHPLDVLDVRRAVAELRVDVVDERVRRLGDVRVGRDDRMAHPARPPRSTRPGSGASGSTASRPSSRMTTPFTTTARIPAASETSRSAPAGKSYTRRSGPQLTVAGSNTVTSAASPAARRPRSRMPKTSAGSDVRRRTASSSDRTLFSRIHLPSSAVGAQASQSWLACAPASDSPSIVAGWRSSSATTASSVLSTARRKRVWSPDASDRSSIRSTGWTPRSAATSARRRSASDASGGCSVICMSWNARVRRPPSIFPRSARRNSGSA